MKQGCISLNIENFELKDLFNLIRKESRAFEMKPLRLEVLLTEICVKADKVLTPFMFYMLCSLTYVLCCYEDTSMYVTLYICMEIFSHYRSGMEFIVSDLVFL